MVAGGSASRRGVTRSDDRFLRGYVGFRKQNATFFVLMVAKTKHLGCLVNGEKR